MQILDYQKKAAARSAELLESCPPKDHRGYFVGANGARHGVR